jgi:HEAT repeat protein
MIDRYDALVAMRSLPLDQKRETLKKAYAKETFFATKSEIIRQLVDDTDPSSRAILRSAITDKDVQLHKAVINNTNLIAADLKADYEKLLLSPSYEVVANTLDKLSFQYPENTSNYLETTKGVIGTAGRNVEVKWLEVKARTGAGDKEATDKLVAYTSQSFEFRTRVNAAQALKRIDYFDETMMKSLFNAIMSPNTRLANPCGEVLNTFYNQARYRKMISDYVASQVWDNRQKAILANMLK